MKRLLRLCLVLLLSESLIFSPLLYAEQLSLPSGDLVAPEVTHTPDTTAMTSGSNKIIKANVTDNVGIKSVILFYRLKGSENYDRLNMSRQGGSSDEYVVEIKDLSSPGIEYYIQATDLAGNTLLHGYAFSPLAVNVKLPPSVPETTVAQSEAESTTTTLAAESSEKSYKWLWIGLGVLAVGAIAAGSGGGGGGGGGGAAADDTSSVIISAPVPQ